MEEIKLKVISASGDTLAVSRAGRAYPLCIPPRVRTVTGLHWNVMSRAYSVRCSWWTQCPRG